MTTYNRAAIVEKYGEEAVNEVEQKYAAQNPLLKFHVLNQVANGLAKRITEDTTQEKFEDLFYLTLKHYLSYIT